MPYISVLDRAAKRALDLIVALTLMLLLTPLVLVLAVAIKLDSRGPVFYRCRRVGLRGREFAMLKFRKMRDNACGPALTVAGDDRLTRFGRFLAGSKFDEIPQLWNVVRGQMSLVGPRPEDPVFVATNREKFADVVAVKPGMTGLSQLAFAKESEILDPDDRVGHYLRRILPQKLELDRLYAARQSVALDVGVLYWTAVALLGGRDVAVHRQTGKLSIRRRPSTVLPSATPQKLAS